VSPLTRRERLSEFSARTIVAVLFMLLSINLLGDFVRTHHLTGLLLLIGEALVVVLTVFRRRAQVVDRRMLSTVITGISLVGPPLLRAHSETPLVPDHMTAAVSIVGLCLGIAGKLSLGRSFGLVPANRGVVAQGPYVLMRHPIYTGYLLSHLAFIVAHPSTWNICIVVLSDAALIVRALLEERVLHQDERYRLYCERVSWHLVPGVF
jgi:protein-S-isoprenylcysteine O-methyltransferase Ste14